MRCAGQVGVPPEFLEAVALVLAAHDLDGLRASRRWRAQRNARRGERKTGTDHLHVVPGGVLCEIDLAMLPLANSEPELVLVYDSDGVVFYGF